MAGRSGKTLPKAAGEQETARSATGSDLSRRQKGCSSSRFPWPEESSPARMELLQRKFRAISSQTHSPALRTCNAFFAEGGTLRGPSHTARRAVGHSWRELGDHSNTGQRESANASHGIRDRIASLIYRGGPDTGLLRTLTMASRFLRFRRQTEV
jgi:hypothetical protein